MKTCILKFFPVTAMVLGLSLAFAAQAFTPRASNTLKGRLPSGQWEAIQPNQQYSCKAGTGVCTAEFDANDVEVPGTEVFGIYTKK